jgi:uncharacterized membrane protein
MPTTARATPSVRRSSSASPGEHNNSGILAFYYAIATLARFFHPLLFMLATTWVIMILARRDFFSRSLRTISGHG